MRNVLSLLFVAALSAPAAAQTAATLPAVFTRAEKLAKSAPKGRRFDLIYERGRWHFLLDPNPPGSGLLLDVTEGEHVRLTLTNQAFRDVDESAMFDINEVGVHVYLQTAGEQKEIEFDAPKEGIYFIRAGQAPIGRLIARKR